MKKKNTSFEKRLLNYSLTAGVIFASQGIANATVHVTTVGQTLTSVGDASGSYPFITINFAGGTYHVFSPPHYASTIAIQTKYDVEIAFRTKSFIAAKEETGHTVVFIGSQGSPSFYAKPLNQSNSVPTNPSTLNSKFKWGTYPDVGYKSTTNAFASKSNKYLGVRIGSGPFHYGWIYLTVNAKANSITINSFAYNDVQNQGISSPLPVELTTFTADNLGGKVELQWNTATEVNNYGFNIERRSPSPTPSQGEGTSGATLWGEWGAIGFVKGSGNSNSPKSYSFVDNNPLSGSAEYRLKQIDNDGSFTYSNVVSVTSLPTQFSLGQNNPNPFNPTTTIRYSIPKAEHVTLKVYDEVGREVASLVDENKEAGSYSVQFSAVSHQLSSGIYFYRITAGNFSEVKKLMLLK